MNSKKQTYSRKVIKTADSLFKHYKRSYALTGLAVLLLSNNVSAQFFESGVEPASVRWRQIHTEHFRIIFPVDAAAEGQRAANTLEYIYKADGKTLNNYPAKIPVVLHNRTAFSNGFVTWTPKRSELFLTPPQDNYAHDWLEQLALHEYRHVVQTDKLNQGFTRAAGFVVGQQAVGAVSGLLPQWFLEGDAVVTETALSNSGRGRNPAFEMPLRTIALSGKYHSYDKALFGSYRDNVPNYYELGYQLVSWTRENYRANAFETAVDEVAQRPYLFFTYPFKRGVKKETGYTSQYLYQHAFADLTSRWSEQETKTKCENAVTLTKRKNNLYTSYRSPQFIDDSTFVAEKTGMAQIAQLVKIDKNGREKILHSPGQINSERISYSCGLLTWTEQIQDVRWTNRSYSVIKLHDVKTGKTRILRNRTRYYSPTLSPDGTALAAIEVPVSGACAIVLLDVNTGKEKYRLPNIREAFLQTPVWSMDGKSLLLIVNNRDGKSIVRIDAETGVSTTVLPPAFDDISNPADGGQYLFFNSYYNGITNVYAVDYRTGKIFQVTSARFGAFDPQPNAAANKLIYAQYSAKGYDIVETDIDTDKWLPIEQLTDNSLKLYKTLARQENFNIQDSVIPEIQYRSKPFRKSAHLFNLHSWAPLYYEVNVSDAASTQFYPGVVLFSQDLLGNLTSSAGYSWEGYNALHASFTYKGLYPVFDFKIVHGGQTSTYDKNRIPILSKTQTQYYINSYVPFMFTRSRWITGMTPQITLSYNNNYFYSPIIDDFQSGLWKISYSLTWYRYLKTSLRDLAPRLGLLFQGSFQHTPWNNDLYGSIYFIYGRAYLPGIAPHHSLRISGAWQEQKVKHYIYQSLLPYPRGYIKGFPEKLSAATIDYSLPICYPDWNLSFLFYMKRLQANLFCDVAQSQNRMRVQKTGEIIWKTDNLYSVGVDLLADVNLMRINFPFNIGIRNAYVPEKSKIYPSLLLSVNFY
jgi:Tol biopolymer transport system component